MTRHPSDEDRQDPKTPRQRAIWVMIFCVVGMSVMASVIMAFRLMSL